MKTQTPTLAEIQDYFKDALEGISVDKLPFKGFNEIFYVFEDYYCRDNNSSIIVIWRDGKYAEITKTIWSKSNYAQITKTKKPEAPTLAEVQEYFKDAAEGLTPNGAPFRGFNNIDGKDGCYFCLDKESIIRILWANGKYATITKTKEPTEPVKTVKFSDKEQDLLTLIEHLQLTLVVSGLKRSKVTDDAIAKLKRL